MKAREVLNEAIIPTDFSRELIKLEEFYISINQDNYYYGTSIEFQSPGIKDYLLEFLRTTGYLWIHPLILKARFYNQLTFVFSTRQEEMSDYDSHTPLYGQKILLNHDLKNILKQKLLEEFESLGFCNHEGKELTDDLTRYHSYDESKYFRMIELNRLFPIDLKENKDVRGFIVDKVLADIESFDENKKVVAHRAMIYWSQKELKLCTLVHFALASKNLTLQYVELSAHEFSYSITINSAYSLVNEVPLFSFEGRYKGALQIDFDPNL